MWIGVEYKISPLSQRSRRVRWLHPPPQPEIFGIKFKGSENVADINLQMTQRNAGNTAWDNLNPITIVENVTGAAKQADLTAHLADVASQVVGKGADMIALPDPNNHFTSTNVGKGTTPASQDFADLVTGVNAISTGKKWASGSGTTTSLAHATVTGLAFNPSIIIISIGGSTIECILSYDAVHMYQFGMSTNQYAITVSYGFDAILTGRASTAFTWEAYE